MSYWVCCNSCFLSPSADRKLAVTSCGHVICSVCYQKGKPGGACLICSAKCHVSPLSDKSSSDVKALFTDINAVASKHLREIGKVIMFQARHQKRLLTYYQQRNEKQEEVLVKMKQEMHHMTKKLNEQSAYITKLEKTLQHQSPKVPSVPQIRHSSISPRGHNSVPQMLYNTPVSLSRHSSTADISDNMEMEEMSLFKKPVSRVSLIGHPQDGRIGSAPHRSQNTLANHSAALSHFQLSPLTPDISYGQRSGWTSPVFRPPSAFRLSSLP